ncbi:hypothetical protein ACFQI7_16485 [Paenibacillus allorhizosphaerae]|nr:hypothetical protein [Paenibacillus allorhizosphaerae]
MKRKILSIEEICIQLCISLTQWKAWEKQLALQNIKSENAS